MTPAPSTEWVRAEAKRLAPLLEGQHAVVISGPDADTSAAVALAIAHLHGATRRVAIADLVGDVRVLTEAVFGGDEDPHGISDSFLYGVSLNRIARPIDPSGNVFLMPSGTEPVALEAVYRNDRWRRLGAGFQQVGALLLVVAVRDVNGFDSLCQYVGALLPVGESSPPAIPDVQTLWLAPPPPPAERVRQVERARVVATEDRGQRQSRMLATLAAAAAVVLLGLAAWPKVQSRFASEPSDSAATDSTRLADSSNPDDTTASEAAGTIAVEAAIGPPVANGAAATDSASAARTASAPTRAPRTGALVVANPGDADRAASFAVYFVSANTVDEARPPARVDALAAVAVSPVPIGPSAARWFRVTVGAGADSAQAVALLNRLRQADQIGANSGSIIRVPYAFRLEEGLAVEMTSDAIARWAQRGIRAYALRQTSGDVTVYTGAFQTPIQATMLADSLHGVGIPPTLVYRTGRTF